MAGNRAVARMVDGGAIQRVKDPWGESLASSDIVLRGDFEKKHVAADAAGAEAVTDQRFQAGKMPQRMQQGRMANSVATAAAWTNAVDASETQVDTTNGKWTKEVAIKVDGWAVRWKPNTQTYSVSEFKGRDLKAGGYSEATMASRRSREVVGGKFVVDHIENG